MMSMSEFSGMNVFQQRLSKSKKPCCCLNDLIASSSQSWPTLHTVFIFITAKTNTISIITVHFEFGDECKFSQRLHKETVVFHGASVLFGSLCTQIQNTLNAPCISHHPSSITLFCSSSCNTPHISQAYRCSLV